MKALSQDHDQLGSLNRGLLAFSRDSRGEWKPINTPSKPCIWDHF